MNKLINCRNWIVFMKPISSNLHPNYLAAEWSRLLHLFWKINRKTKNVIFLLNFLSESFKCLRTLQNNWLLSRNDVTLRKSFFCSQKLNFFLPFYTLEGFQKRTTMKFISYKKRQHEYLFWPHCFFFTF